MYNNEMKTLINSIESISFGYMNSNSTLNKFGIEYSYITTAMNSMLGFTNNNIKNMQINGTESIVIDYNLVCIFSFLGTVLAVSSFELALLMFLVFGGPVDWAILGLSLLLIGMDIGPGGIILSC